MSHEVNGIFVCGRMPDADRIGVVGDSGLTRIERRDEIVVHALIILFRRAEFVD